MSEAIEELKKIFTTPEDVQKMVKEFHPELSGKTMKLEDVLNEHPCDDTDCIIHKKFDAESKKHFLRGITIGYKIAKK